jgi:TRAP-type C4-dicarboxylate transport system permease small subunit|tara:strand:- start:3398 stop:3898 length:501 start_codon:yes stop_codon:yes gene_type:complete
MVKSFSRFLKVLGGLITAGFLSLILYATLSRYVFNRPVDFSDELAALLFVTCAFIGILSSAVDNDHIEINIVTERMRSGWRRLTKRLAALVCAGFFSIFAYHSYEFAQFSRQIGALTEGAALPVSYWMYVMPLASALAAVTYAYRMFVAPSFDTRDEDHDDRSAEF